MTCSALLGGVKVRYRDYGSTGMKVSAIGFGGMRFENIDDADACAAMVCQAYDAGINYFDTAPGYFGGRSEERFGLAFREMKKTRAGRPFYVSTKSNKGNPSEIRQDLEASLERMGLDHIDVFHMWWVVRKEWYHDRKALGALEEFTRLKEEGLAKSIALSSHMSGDEITEVLADYDFDGVLLGYSAMNARFRDRAVTAAARDRRGVVVMNPLGGGIIPAHPDKFGFLRTQPEETVAEGALRFLLNDRRISVVLVGFGTPGHIDEALKAEKGFKPIPRPTIEEMRGRFARDFDTVCTGCGYCLPCPQGLPVPRLMQSYNELVFRGKVESMLSSMKWAHGVLEAPLDTCTQCGICAGRCTQKLPIPERISEMRVHVEADKAEKAAKGETEE
jgi:predicted aldo/keto reductase-like oxidoreductase